MEQEAIEYADKILQRCPEELFERQLFERKPLDEDEPDILIPVWQPELLLQLISDGLLEKTKKEDEYDFQTKFAYSITSKGYDLVSKGISYETFLKNKIVQEQKEKERQEKDDIIQNLTINQLKRAIWQLKYWWLFLLLNFMITLITIFLSKHF